MDQVAQVSVQTDVVGTLLKVWDRSNDWFIVCLDEEPTVDASVSRWVDSGRTRDTILHLVRLDGDVFHILASEITSWVLSTQGGRLRDWVWEKTAEDEREAHKREAGFPWE